MTHLRNPLTLGELARCLDAVDNRQIDIDDDDTRLLLIDEVYCFAPIAGLAADIEVAMVSNRARKRVRMSARSSPRRMWTITAPLRAVPRLDFRQSKIYPRADNTSRVCTDTTRLCTSQLSLIPNTVRLAPNIACKSGTEHSSTCEIVVLQVATSSTVLSRLKTCKVAR